MKIKLKTLKQETFELEVIDYNVTILELKQLIELNFNYDHTKLKLLFNSVILEDNKKLIDYNIEDEFTIVMSNLKVKKLEEIKNVNNQDNDDLGLYSENMNSENNLKPENKEADDYDPINVDNSNNLNSNIVDNQEEEEQVYEADIKADNAVQYVASIMKILCLKEPEKAKEFFKNFEEDNPQIMRLIKKNDAEFKRLLYSPKTDQDVQIFKQFYRGEMKEENPDEDNIKKLMDYGFPYNKCKEAYYACDKQFELALNLLLEGNI